MLLINDRTAKAALLGMSLVCFGLGMLSGVAVTNGEKQKVIDAAKVEIINNRDYDRLTPASCQTDYECQTAQILQDYQDGRLVFMPLESDWQPVYEPPPDEQYEKQRAKEKLKTLEKVN